MTNEDATARPMEAQSDVEVATATTGPDEYRIVASATLEAGPAEVWELLGDWERFLAVGLPGQTSDFKWLSGSPDQVPSTFEFAMAGATIREEIYERTADEPAGLYRLRYRVLEPALGVLEYDAVLELRGRTGGRTAFSATREVRLEPGSPAEMLAGMVEAETHCLKRHFGR